MKKVSKIFLAIGTLEIVSGIVVYPSLAVMWRSQPIINYYLPMEQYSYFAFSLGVITVIIGKIITKKHKNLLNNLSLLFIVLSIIFLSDRLLLAKYGKGLWKYDAVLHYKQRPNTVFTWGKNYNNKLIKINSNGYHDDEFSLVKSKNEYRIFMLGNSITMGHGVTKEETFSSQLEKLPLTSKIKLNVFNLGVQGYSTEQELEVLKREIKYDPNLIILEFCLNDITEPIAVNKEFGGTGFDYHMIYETGNKILGYFINETGFGRLLYRIKFINKISHERENELKQINNLAIKPFSNKKLKKSWMITFNSIKKIKSISVQKDIPFIVLIFPYTFQLWHRDLQKPQEQIKSFLKLERIPFIDFTEIFEVKLLNRNTKDYYLDEDHYTAIGHTIIANEILDFLLTHNYLIK